MMNDIQSRIDIDKLLAVFYGRIREEERLGPIFNGTIPDDHWPAHLEKIGDFWETILFQNPKYRGAPMPAHIRLDQVFPLEQNHFDRWVNLFHTAVDEMYTGEIADEAKKRATLMAGLINFKVESARRPGFVQ